MSTDNCAMPELISVDQAISNILSNITPVSDSETVSILDALNRVVSEDIHSAIDVPGYDNTAMDGYAVHSDDCSQPGAVLPVVQRIAAGSVGSELEKGTAARIFTGAPIPEGADAVVMQEMCQRAGEQVTVNCTLESGENIRNAGEDIKSESVVISAGKRLRPQEQGLLASIGLSHCQVLRKLKVAIFFTGDEIIAPGEPLQPGQIYNSNRYTLRGLLQSSGCEVIDLGIVPDTLEATLDVMRNAAEDADMIITSGGVSVGEEDYVRIALEKLGEVSMWRIAMKPGKPVVFGKISDSIFMGLPGNPVSVFVTYLIFARVALKKMQGITNCLPNRSTVVADFEWPEVKRQEYLRVKLVMKAGRPVAQLYPKQGSGVLSSASWADGLAEAFIGKAIKRGDMINYLSFEGLI